MFAWWGQRAKICWTSSLHAHVCLALSLSWRVLPCPNILLGAGLDAGNSAVRLSCIAFPTLSCHVTVFAPHLPLPVSVTPPLSLSARQQGLQLYTVITLSFCRSSALVASRRASRRHRSCILHARLEKYCDSFRRWKHTRMLMMRSQLWQVREIVRKRAQKIELNKLVIQLWKHFPYRVIVNWVSSPLFAGPWSPCGHTLVCPCVYMCANFSYMCTQCAFLGEFRCLCLCRCHCLCLCPSAVRRRRRRRNKLFKWQLNSHKMKTRCLHCSQQLFEFRLFMALKMDARQRVY